MKNRANIVDGPGYTAFLFLLPHHGCKSKPSKKALFFLDDPQKMPGDQKVMLLTITKVEGNGNVGEWHFEGEAGGRSFKGFLSPGTGSGWIEPV